MSKIELKSQRATVEKPRARQLEKEIIQTRDACLDKISASAREKAAERWRSRSEVDTGRRASSAIPTESPGLRVGPLAHPGSAQPEPVEN